MFPIIFIGHETTFTGYRDKGSNITLVKKNVISDEYLIPTNDYVDLQHLQSGTDNVLVFVSTASSDIINRDIKIAVLPDDAVMPTDTDFILGNDIGPELPLSMQNSKIVATPESKQSF